MVAVRGEFHRDLIGMLSTRGALDVKMSELNKIGQLKLLPTSVEVPGGVAFLTSSFDRLKAALRDVIVEVRDDEKV